MMLAMAGTNLIHLFAAPGTATTAVPAGVPVASGFGASGVGRLFPAFSRRADRWNLVTRITAAGAITFQGVLWIISQNLGTFAAQTVDLNVWAPAGKSATIANRGMLNDPGTGPTTLTGSDLVTHREPYGDLGSIDGAYLQITTLTGAGAAVHAWLIGVAPGA